MMLNMVTAGVLQQLRDQGKAEGLAVCKLQMASPFVGLNKFHYKVFIRLFWGGHLAMRFGTYYLQFSR